MATMKGKHAAAIAMTIAMTIAIAIAIAIAMMLDQAKDVLLFGTTA